MSLVCLNTSWLRNYVKWKQNKLKQLPDQKDHNIIWLSETIQWCLVIRSVVGSNGYKYLRQTNYPLPSDCTLCRHTQNCTLTPGIQHDVMQWPQVKMSTAKESEKLCVLLVDEMLLKSCTEFDRGLRQVVRYVSRVDRARGVAERLFSWGRKFYDNRSRQPEVFDMLHYVTSKCVRASSQTTIAWLWIPRYSRRPVCLLLFTGSSVSVPHGNSKAATSFLRTPTETLNCNQADINTGVSYKAVKETTETDAPHAPHVVGVPQRQSHRRSGLATLPSVGAVPYSPHIIVDSGTCCVYSCILYLYTILCVCICVFCVFLCFLGCFPL